MRDFLTDSIVRQPTKSLAYAYKLTFYLQVVFLIQEIKFLKRKKIARPYIIGPLSKKMGEEKPDEELMGKRKSSPRLSTTSRTPMNILWTRTYLNILVSQKNIELSDSALSFINNRCMVGLIRLALGRNIR